MRYFKDTFKYFFDKGAYLVLLTVVPSLMLPFLVSPSEELYFLLQYEDISFSSFGALYTQMHQLPFEWFWIGIVGVVLYGFVLALLFGIVDRHMRIGEFTISFRRAKARINYNILTAFKFVLFIVVTFELSNFFTAILYYLWYVVFGAGLTWLVFSAVSLLVSSLLFLMAMSSVILWPPFMLHTGYNTLDAFVTAWKQISGKLIYVALTLVVVVLPFQITMIITGALNTGVVVAAVLDGLCYAIIMPVYIVLMYNIFYDITGTERMDLQKKDIWSKNLPKG